MTPKVLFPFFIMFCCLTTFAEEMSLPIDSTNNPTTCYQLALTNKRSGKTWTIKPGARIRIQVYKYQDSKKGPYRWVVGKVDSIGKNCVVVKDIIYTLNDIRSVIYGEGNPFPMAVFACIVTLASTLYGLGTYGIRTISTDKKSRQKYLNRVIGSGAIAVGSASGAIALFNKQKRLDYGFWELTTSEMACKN